MSNSTPSKNSQPSKNALTHGFYAADVVLAGENQQQFDELLQGYRDEYCPDGVSEEAAVFDLASLHWKKHRLEARLQQALQQLDLGPAADTSDPIGDIIRAAAKSQLAPVQHACESLRKQAEQVCKADQAKAASLLVEFEKLTASLKEFNLGFGDLASSLRRAEEQRFDHIARIYLPDILEKSLKIQAEINRQIDKVLKRLVMAKEFKRLYGAKSVNANQIEATKLPAKSSHEADGA
jgi:hypothetical protein